MAPPLFQFGNITTSPIIPRSDRAPPQEGVKCCAVGSLIREDTRRVCARKRGVEKAIYTLSLEKATPLGKTVGCGDVLTASSTTPLGKLCGGTRLIAVPNGNKLEDWIIRSGEPKCATEKHMVPVQRSQGCRSQMRDYSSRCGLRYDPALCESTGVY